MLFFSSHGINTTGGLNSTHPRYQLPHHGTSHNDTSIGTFPHSNHTGHGPYVNHTFTSRADTTSNSTTTPQTSTGNAAAFGIMSCIIALLFCFLGFVGYYIYRVHKQRKNERVAFLGRDPESGEPNKLPPFSGVYSKGKGKGKLPAFPGVYPNGIGKGEGVARASPYTTLPAPAAAPLLTIPRKPVPGISRIPSEGWSKKWNNTAQQLAAQDEYLGPGLAFDGDSDGGNSTHSSHRSTAPILLKPALLKRKPSPRAPSSDITDADGFTTIPLTGGKPLPPLPTNFPVSKDKKGKKNDASGKSPSAAPVIPQRSSSKPPTQTREVRLPTFGPADDDDGFHPVDVSYDAGGMPVPWFLAPVKMEMDLEVFMSKQPKKVVVVEQSVVHPEAQSVEIEIWENQVE